MKGASGWVHARKYRARLSDSFNSTLPASAPIRTNRTPRGISDRGKVFLPLYLDATKEHIQRKNYPVLAAEMPACELSTVQPMIRYCEANCLIVGLA